MKLTTKQTNRVGNHKTKGFTLIEMIGVLAVIAILAAVLVPKVFTAINNSRINNTAMSCNTVKTAIVDHYAKAGSLLANATTVPPTVFALGSASANLFDTVLIAEQFMDKPFSVKIGDGAAGTAAVGAGGHNHIEIIACPTAATTVDGTDATGYVLDGVGTVNEAVGTALVQAVITGVVESDAQALSAIIDGPAMSQTVIGNDDTAGRVKYTHAGAGGTTTVFVYLSHR